MKKILVVLSAVILVLGSIGTANAITLSATDSGWYNLSSGHFSGNKNYAIGSSDSYRNYFVFDLNSVVDTIISATLRVNVGQVGGSGDINYDLYDVTTSISDLMASWTSVDPETAAIFNDLGTGTLYGATTFSSSLADYSVIIDISLNAAALSELNSTGGLWAIGGRNSNLSTNAFYGTGADLTRELVLETVSAPVPEPATLILLGSGLVGLAFARRRKKS